jgi:hypothetical protein
MIVLLDVQMQKITLYGSKGMKVIPFAQAQDLLDHVEGETVFYVTQAIEVTALDILAKLKEIGVPIQESFPLTDSGMKYVRAAKEGTIYINDNLKFEGKFDLKPLDENMSAMFKRLPILQALLQKKQIEIVGEVRRRAILKEFQQHVKKQEQMQAAADAELDKIILKGRVEDWDGTIAGGDDVPEMDITSAVGSRDMLTEEERVMQQVMRTTGQRL